MPESIYPTNPIPTATTRLTEIDIFNRLQTTLKGQKGFINFQLAGVNVTINRTDIVGNVIQSWLAQWFINNGIDVWQPENTQAFPDFYVKTPSGELKYLEVKSFINSNQPAFDIANYESYMKTIQENFAKIEAHYIIFGYEMNPATGSIEIKQMWLKRVWEIAGPGTTYALNVQIKKNVIYNIRPKNFKDTKANSTFPTKESFLEACYQTLAHYRTIEKANQWLSTIKAEYLKKYGAELNIEEIH